ncbi:alpha/beta fold hydrolase [Erythrobacter arachoides]|uniref:Alpha/beta fold hydrolase n=1 Tax=Aurantiacibacter arachoides TaxID=1850444 RepID=A0A844ZY38_9SPHN|nr:alpha/beta fold hydrolase [Aurantiacibacter arachoides]MXO92120.1 alpha/beta fold hydrolase [Aurantiacibacter arachoides]GGD59553.1 hypothetical protein GCM10011411_19690 [Aurantiacibacter arachoides]
MTDFVLVHGAWGGAHTWGEVPAMLEAQGHRVLVATLPGLGSRQDELHPGITLTDHVADVERQVAEAGFARFVLAGHSYGGMVVTGLAARLGARIDALAYIDAFVPRPGESLWDITGAAEHAWYIDTQKHKPGMVDPIGALDFKLVPGKVGYQPLLTLLEAVEGPGEAAAIPRRAYLYATGWSPTPFTRFAEKARADGWDYHEVATDHFVMTGDAETTVRVLAGLGG